MTSLSYSVKTVMVILLIAFTNTISGKTIGRPTQAIVMTDIVGTNDSSTDTIKAKADTIAMKGVEVVARLIEHKGNTDIYQVTRDLIKNTHTAAELIGKVPGIYYDPVTTGLSYLGSSKIMLIIDGMEKDAAYIKMLNPDRFSKISIENQPVGRYEGYDAVINLITKSTYDGYDGVILAEGQFATADRNGAGHSLMNQRDDFQFTYTRDKWNIALFGNYNHIDEGTRIGYDRQYPLNDYFQKVEVPLSRHPNRRVRQDNGKVALWIDRLFNNNRRLSVGLIVTPASGDVTERVKLLSGNSSSHTSLTNIDKNRQPSLMDMQATVQYHGKVGRWNFRAEGGIDRISRRSEHSVERPGYRLQDFRKIRSTFGWIGGSAAIGFFQSRLIFNVYDYATWIGYDERRMESGKLLSETNSFRNRMAASLTYSPSRRWQVGMTAGFTLNHNSMPGLSETHVAPRLSVNAMLMTGNALFRFNYATSIGYAPLSQSQDYSYFTDSLTYQSGNPLLRSSLKHKFNLSATLLRDLTVSCEYIYGHNHIYNIADIMTDAMHTYVWYRYRNGTSSNWKANMSYNKSISHWNFAATLSVERQKASFEHYTSAKTLPNYSWHAMYFNNRYDFQAYLSSSLHPYLAISPQQIGWEQSDGYSLSAVKFFLKGKLQLVAVWSLPIHFIRKPYHSVFESPGYVAHEYIDSYRRSDNSIRFTVVWRFNGGQQTRRYNRTTESIDL